MAALRNGNMSSALYFYMGWDYLYNKTEKKCNLACETQALHTSQNIDIHMNYLVLHYTRMIVKDV